MKGKNVITILFVSLLFFGFGAAVYAQSSSQNSPIVNVDFQCPGCTTGKMDIVTYINNFYKFSLWIGGALALGMIVAGGIMRIVSAGSPDKLREASEMITSSIFGLLLLFGSYLVLNTINPEITLLKLPAAGEGDAKLAAQTTDSITASECGGTNAKSFEAIRVWDGKIQRSDLNCIYRRSVTPTAIGLTSGEYYDTNLTVPAKSMVWLYPYFPRSGGSSKAECLIYAFLSTEKDAQIKMVDLDTELQLCAPKFQSLGGPICKAWMFTAKESTIESFDTSDTSQYKYIGYTVIPSDAFPYYDPLSQPPRSITKSDGTKAGPVPGQDNVCYTTYCAEEKWTCSDVETPKLDMPANDVNVGVCNTCSDVPSSFSFNSNPCNKAIKDTNRNANGNCRLNDALIQKLTAFKNSFGGGWQINEAWPPTVPHLDSCHADGTCVDIALSDIGLKNGTCTNVVKALSDLKKAGLGASVNEYKECGGTTYKTTTGGHIHVQW